MPHKTYDDYSDTTKTRVFFSLRFDKAVTAQPHFTHSHFIKFIMMIVMMIVFLVLPAQKLNMVDHLELLMVVSY